MGSFALLISPFPKSHFQLTISPLLLSVNKTASCGQITEGPLNSAFNNSLRNFIVTSPYPAQSVSSITFTTYLVFTFGVANGLAIVGSERPAGGDHSYLFPPLAVT